MITMALLDLLGGVLLSLFGLLPEIEIDASDFFNAGASMGGIIWWFDGYVPVGSLFTGLGLLFAVWVAMAAWNAALFIYHQFWGSS